MVGVEIVVIPLAPLTAIPPAPIVTLPPMSPLSVQAAPPELSKVKPFTYTALVPTVGWKEIVARDPNAAIESSKRSWSVQSGPATVHDPDAVKSVFVSFQT
jgi:hypothetical protein